MASNIHKNGIPLRPISSAIKTSSNNISKYLVGILENLTTNNYTLKNSYEFANFISKFRNTNQLFMCSFYIKSLYTNIPLNETIEIILNKLFQILTAYIKTLLKQILNYYYN